MNREHLQETDHHIITCMFLFSVFQEKVGLDGGQRVQLCFSKDPI